MRDLCSDKIKVKTFLIGKAFTAARDGDNKGGVALLRYYAGWADKINGKTIEVGCDLAFPLHSNRPSSDK